MRLQGKVAVVTGSGQGIGLGIARRFAEEGAAVVVADRDEAALANAEKELRELGERGDRGRVRAVRADVSRSADAAHLFEQALAAFGTVDILVNNAAWAAPIAHFLEM